MFLKSTICVRGGHCDQMPWASVNVTTPLQGRVNCVKYCSRAMTKFQLCNLGGVPYLRATVMENVLSKIISRPHCTCHFSWSPYFSSVCNKPEVKYMHTVIRRNTITTTK